MASQQPTPSSRRTAGASARMPSTASSPPPPPSRHHVTPQILTLGRRDDDGMDDDKDGDYYRRSSDADQDDDVDPQRIQPASSPPSSWYARILPKNPFASAAPASMAEDDESRRKTPTGGAAAAAPADLRSSYRSLGDGGGGGDGGEDDQNHGIRSESGPAAARQRYIPSSRRLPLASSVVGGLSQPILAQGTAPTSVDEENSATNGRILRGKSTARTTSVEDEIAQQSFFYNCDDEGSSPQGESRGPATQGAGSRWNRHHHHPSRQGRRSRRGDGLELSSGAAALSSSSSTSFRTLLYDPARTTELGYRDLASLHVSLAPPVLSRYRAKYELLNQPMATRIPSASSSGRRTGPRLYHFYNADAYDDDDDLSEGGDDFYVRADSTAATTGTYDLELCEQTGPLSKVRRTDSAALSSLLYRSDRGRVLLRLPSDQVRLVMDPDLQPGILSVEQWRKGEQEYSNETNRPSLHYVLTVQEDLYRKIVGELSDAVTNPYCGMSKCCSEKEFVDIRVAVAIVGFMLSVLLLLTFVWPVS